MGNVLIVGVNDEAYLEAIRYLYGSYNSHNLVGFISNKHKLYTKIFLQHAVIGKVYQVPFIIKKYDINTIVVMCDVIDKSEIIELSEIGTLLNVKVKFVSNQFIILPNKSSLVQRLRFLRSELLINSKRFIYNFAKRITDFFISFLGLIYSSPLLLLFIGCCGIKNNFIKKRIPIRNKHITLIKLRLTKSNNMKKWEKIIKRIFEKYALGNMLILINTFKGELSFIGPKISETFSHNSVIENKKSRLKVRPGLTSMWQMVNDVDLNLKDISYFDEYYKDNLSLFLDLKIFYSILRSGYNFKKEEYLKHKNSKLPA